MQEIDNVPQLEIEAFHTTSELIDKIVLFAGRVASLSDVGVSSGDVFEELHSEYFELRTEVYDVPNIDFSFNGVGFVPNFDLDDVPVTTHISVDSGVGKISDLVLIEPSRFEYVTIDSNDESIVDDDLDSSLSVLDHRDSSLEDIITSQVDPKDGLRLYVEFLVNQVNDPDATIGSPLVRTDEIRTYNLIEAETLIIDRMDMQDSVIEILDFEDIPEYLTLMSDKFIKMLKDTKFRRMNLEKQKQQFKSIITSLNEKVRFDEVSTLINADYAYAHSIYNGERQTIKLPIAGENLIVKPIRVDSLEAYNLYNGNRIYKDECIGNLDTGLCLVGEVEYAPGIFKDAGIDILWIPISGQELEAMHVEDY